MIFEIIDNSCGAVVGTIEAKSQTEAMKEVLESYGVHIQKQDKEKTPSKKEH